MQTVLKGTRHHQSVLTCIKLARVTPSFCEAVSSSDLGLSDQWQGYSTATVANRAASQCCTRLCSDDTLTRGSRTFASTAEFSGGTFNVSSSSSSSENDDNRQSSYDPDMDVKEMLLESWAMW